MQADLGAPVVAEVDSFAGEVFDGLGEHEAIVVANAGEEVGGEIGVGDEIHHQVFHAAEGPGPLPER